MSSVEALLFGCATWRNDKRVILVEGYGDPRFELNIGNGGLRNGWIEQQKEQWHERNPHSPHQTEFQVGTRKVDPTPIQRIERDGDSGHEEILDGGKKVEGENSELVQG